MTTERLVLKVDSSSVDRASKHLDELTSSANKATKGAGKLAAGFTALAGAVASIGLVSLTKDAAASGKQIDIFTRQLDISTETMTRWGYAAQDVGFTTEKMADVFKDVSEKIGDAFINQGGEAYEALNNLGLASEYLVNLSPDQQLLEIASALDQIQSQSGKIQIMEALANDASRLIPLLDDNAKAFRQLSDESDRLGATLSGDQVKALKETDKVFRDISTSVQTTINLLSIELSSTIIDISTKVKTFIPVIKELFSIFQSPETKLQERFKQISEQIAETEAQIEIMKQTAKGGIPLDLATAQIDLLNLKEALGGVIEEMSKLGVSPDLKIKGTDLVEEDSHVLLYEAMQKREAIINESNHRISETIREFNRRESEEYRLMWESAGNSIARSLGDATADILMEQKSFAEASKELARLAVRQVVSGLVEIGIKRAFLASQTAAQITALTSAMVTSNAAIATSAAPAAAGVSLATAGGNAAPANAGMAATYSFAKALALSGQAHDGLDYVPNTGTYLLEKGERVVKKEDNKKLEKAIDGGMGSISVNFNMNVSNIGPQETAAWFRQNQQIFKNLAIAGVNEALNARGRAGVTG